MGVIASHGRDPATVGVRIMETPAGATRDPLPGRMPHRGAITAWLHDFDLTCCGRRPRQYDTFRIAPLHLDLRVTK